MRMVLCRVALGLLAWAMAGVGGSWTEPALGVEVARASPAGARADPADASDWLLVSAQGGNLLAQETVAVKYYFGEGFPRDYSEAIKWVRMAVEGGASSARAYFSDARLDGRGARNPVEVLRWLRLGVAKGSACAHELLGTALYRGEGVPRDPTGAAKILRPAAEQGLARAQYTLGRMYARGEGVSEDRGEALVWLTRAAEQGVVEAQFELGALYAAGWGAPAGDEEAVRWLRRAAVGHSEEAKRLLWALAEASRAPPRDPRESREWLQAAAESGDPEAQRRCGDLWRRREGTPTHLSEYGSSRVAAFWYSQSARQGHAGAQYELARMLLRGMGMDPDPLEAFAWASLAAEGNHPGAEELRHVSEMDLDRTVVAGARKRAEALRKKIYGK